MAREREQHALRECACQMRLLNGQRGNGYLQMIINYGLFEYRLKKETDCARGTMFATIKDISYGYIYFFVVVNRALYTIHDTFVYRVSCIVIRVF